MSIHHLSGQAHIPKAQYDTVDMIIVGISVVAFFFLLVPPAPLFFFGAAGTLVFLDVTTLADVDVWPELAGCLLDPVVRLPPRLARWAWVPAGRRAGA